MPIRVIAPLIIVHLACSVSFAQSGYPEAGREVATAGKEGGKQVGEAVQKGGKSSAQGAKKLGKATGRAVKSGTQDTRRAIKRIGAKSSGAADGS